MRDIFTLFLHAIVTIIRLARLGGLRAVVAESVLMRHQVLILNRGRKRAPNLRSSDRYHRRFVHSIHATGACFTFCRCLEDLDSAAFS
jgi:hypothetical protein